MVEYYVNTTGNDTSGDGSISKPFATINKALIVCVNGDIINIAEGTYTGNFDISKQVTINGPNRGIHGDSNQRVLEAIFTNTKTTISSIATLDGLKFKHNQNITDALIIASGPTVKNCVFERIADVAGQTARAISVSPGAENFAILNNLFTGSNEGGLFSGHKTWNSGIFITNQGKIANISSNTFRICRTAINADDNNSLVTLNGNNFTTCGTYISYGGTTAPIAGMMANDNIFNISTLGSALINNSNVASTFKTNISNNKFQFAESILSVINLSMEQKFTIESKLLHKGLSSRNGIVYFVNNQQFVLSTLTTIATAISYAPTTGETINIAAGTYAGNFSISKSIALIGAARDTTIIQVPTSSNTPVVTFSPGSSGTIISNFTIKGRFITQTIIGNGNSGNPDSGIFFEGTSLINNVTLENLDISQSSNGIAFNNSSSNNVMIKSCLIRNNEGSGIRIASNTASFNGLTVDSCTIQDNNGSAITANPSDLDNPNCTNYEIRDCLIRRNNKLTISNSNDVSIFGFNGHLKILNTVIECDHRTPKITNNTAKNIGGWGLAIRGYYNLNASAPNRKGPLPSGNITLSNLKITGNVVKSVFGFYRYSTIGNIVMENFDIKDCEPNVAESITPWGQFGIGHNDITKSLPLGNTKLKTIYIIENGTGDIDATLCSFYNNLTGILLDKTNTADLIQIQNQIYDKTYNPILGKIIIIIGEDFVSPIVPNSIANALSDNQIAVVNLASGTFTQTFALINRTSNFITLQALGMVIIIRR